MATFQHEIFIKRPPDAVFACVADVRTHPTWQSGLEGTEGEALDARRVGARGAEVRRMLGRPIRFPYEIVVYEPPRRWGFRALGGPIRPEVALQFTSENGGTRVQSTMTIPGVLGWLAGRALLSQQRQNYIRLKQLLESGEL